VWSVRRGQTRKVNRRNQHIDGPVAKSGAGHQSDSLWEEKGKAADKKTLQRVIYYRGGRTSTEASFTG